VVAGFMLQEVGPQSIGHGDSLINRFEGPIGT
jgi:hypothetical protein